MPSRLTSKTFVSKGELRDRIKVLEKMVNVWKEEARKRRGCIEELGDELERSRVQVVTLELQLQRALVDVAQAKKPELLA